MLIIGFFFIYRGRPTASIKIPVDFSYNLLNPLIKVQIEEKGYDLLVDTGSSSNEFTLQKNVVEKVQKKELVENFEMYDLRGNTYSCRTYRIPKIKIKGFSFFDVSVTEQSDEYEANVLVWLTSKVKRKQDARIRGKIGLSVFQKYCCLFDFPNSQIILEKGIKELENVCSLNDFTCIPFSIEPWGVVISVKTDVGESRMILDTGATYSVINNSVSEISRIEELGAGSGRWCYSSSQLIIGGIDYGSWDFALFDIGKEFKVDGCLGADFFLEYTIALDFESMKAYIMKPEKASILTQWKRLKIRTSQFCNRMLSHVH